MFSQNDRGGQGLFGVVGSRSGRERWISRINLKNIGLIKGRFLSFQPAFTLLFSMQAKADKQVLKI